MMTSFLILLLVDPIQTMSDRIADLKAYSFVITITNVF